MHPLIRTARTTGLLYLAVAITGLLGFLVVRSQLFVAGDEQATLTHLMQRQPLARTGIALELLLVLTQALAAVWFYRLFRGVDPLPAAGITVFGMVNAIAVLGSAACLATASGIAADPVGDPAATVQLLYLISENLWTAGGLFFGLWLIPMGRCVLHSGWMPRPLGWLLMVGGTGYLVSTFVSYLTNASDTAALILVLPATVGEFWMIGYLLLRGAPPGR